MPTRTGYSFVGWKGRNLININRSYRASSLLSFNIEGDKMTLTNEANTTGKKEYSCVIIPIEDLTDGRYWLSYEDVNYSGECNEPAISVYGKVSQGFVGTGMRVVYNTGKLTAAYFDFSTLNGLYNEYYISGEYHIEIYVSVGSSFEAGSLSFSNLMLTKVSSENEVVRYEPYFIQRDTIFNNPGDRTLVAEWTPNSNNLFTNGDFEDVYTKTNTGWDNSINGTLHATGWNDYNGGISNPSTAVHAHIKDISSTDSQHGHVFEMIGAHREYIATRQRFESTTKITTGTYRITASIKGVSGENCFGIGLHYAKTGTGYDSCEFYSGLFSMRFKTTEWIRINYVFSITQISYSDGVYFYGSGNSSALAENPSMNNIFYLDDVFLEKIA